MTKTIAQLASEIFQEPKLGRRRLMLSRVPVHQQDAVKRAVTQLWASGRQERRKRATEWRP